MSAANREANLPAEVTHYLESLPDERRHIVTALHDLILSLYPRVRVDFSYRMPTYRHGKGWVSVADRKRYVSLYTCGAQHIARFRERHPNVPTGRGCINLRSGDPLPVNDLSEVISHAMDHPGDDR